MRLFLLIAALPLPALAADYVVDPLTASTMAGRGSRGGTFSAAGWTTTAVDDSVWWEIPDALPDGRVEYTMTGAQVGTTITEADNDLLAIYQAPVGVAEPVNYTPYFRNNDMKVFTRVFGSAAGTIGGSYKVNLTFCPIGAPWYDNTFLPTCPLCTDVLSYARGPYVDIGWNAATAYRLVVTWGNGTMAFLRDGELLGSVTYPGTFAPQPLRVRIGGPRNAQVSQSAMPIGITLSDVKVSGTPGTRSTVCSALTPDAGTVTPPVDAGCLDGARGASQDVTAAAYETGVFSDPGDLNPEQNVGVVYLKFPALGGTATDAKLKVRSQDFASAAGGSGQVCRVTDDTWSETTLTWANRPAVSSTCIGPERPVGPDEEVEWNVTSLLTASGNQNLAIVTNDANAVHYYSKESGGCAKGPRLYATVTPVIDGGSGGGSGGGTGGGTGGGGGGAGGGTGGSGGGSGGSGGTGGGDAGESADGGSSHTTITPCGCGAAPGAMAWALLLALRALRRTSRRAF